MPRQLKNWFGVAFLILVAVGVTGKVTHDADAASTKYLRAISIAGGPDYIANHDFNSQGWAEAFGDRGVDPANQHVDWAVNMIFWNGANKQSLQQTFRIAGVQDEGSAQWGAVLDSGRGPDQGGGWKVQKDKGVKTQLWRPYGKTNHMRLYADGNGQNMYNDALGYYVIGTTHKDVYEVPIVSAPWEWFGQSEKAERWFAEMSWTLFGKDYVDENSWPMENQQGWPKKRRVGDHEWEVNGEATLVDVSMVRAQISGPGGPGPEPPDEEPPEVTPAESDVNADGKADLVTLHSNGTAATYLGSSSSKFATSAESFAGTMDPALYDGVGHHVVDVAGVNQDPYADLVTLTSWGTACVYLGQSDGKFGGDCIQSFAGTMKPGLLRPGGHEPVGVADVTGDGLGDFVSFYDPMGVVVVYPGQANGTFGEGVHSFAGTMNSALFDGAGHYLLDASDVTGDGRADLVTATTTGVAVVYPGQSNGSFGDGVQSFTGTLDVGLSDGSGHEPVAIGDVTGDGRSDFVSFAAQLGVVVVYPGQSNGSFGDGVQSFGGTMKSSLFDGYGHELATVIDVNGDNYGDLVTAYSNGSAYVYPGRANGSFDASVESFAGTYDSSRFDGVGHEIALEKPSFRRRGCPPRGCWSRRVESDVDADGKADLVTLASSGTAYTYPGKLNFEFGPSTASFAGTMDPALADGTGHHVIDVADVNGDAYSDLVTLTSWGTACVYPGQGDRSFNGNCIESFAGTMQPGLFKPGDHEPIAVADVNGDGRADLVTFFASGDIVTYHGQTNGTFAVPITSFGGAMNSARWDRSGHYFLDVADVTGDGRADLVTNHSNGNAYVFPGQSNGGFGGGVSSFGGSLDSGLTDTVGHEPIGVADVTGDGRADLVTFYSPTKEIVTYPGQSNGGFGYGTHSFTGTTLNSSLFDKGGWELSTLLDVNGDGYTDLVTSTGTTVHVYTGNANGMFTTWTPSFSGAFDTSRFDGVGQEMAMEKPSFRRRGCAPDGCNGITESDVNADGRADLVTLSSSGTAYTYPGKSNFEFGSGSASFAGTMDSALYDGTGHHVIDVEDVDGDLYADLVTLTSSGTACVHRGLANGTFAGCTGSFNGTMQPGLLTPGGYEPIAVSDVTGDHRGDLVALVPGIGDILTYPGQSNGTFGAAVHSFGGTAESALFDRSGHYWIDVADVTGDGRADLVSNHTSGSAHVFAGNANGSFGTWTGSLVGALDNGLMDGVGHEPIGVADVTGDKRADLVTFNSTTGETFTHPGQSNGGFGAPVKTFAGSGMHSSLFDKTGWALATLLDVNGDGHSDLVATHTAGSAHVYAGTPSGNFGTWTPSFAGSYDSSRFDGVGQEIAMEKPSFRRRGCDPNGCFVP